MKNKISYLVTLLLLLSIIPPGNAQDLFNYQVGNPVDLSLKPRTTHTYGVGRTDYYLFNRNNQNCNGTTNDNDCYTYKSQIDLKLDLYEPTGPSIDNKKKAVIIMIPGSGRNADECRDSDPADVASCGGQWRERPRNGNQKWLISEQSHYSRFKNSVTKAQDYAKMGFVVVVLNTRYKYHNLKYDDKYYENVNVTEQKPKHRWKDSDGKDILNNSSLHLENLVVDIKRAVRWLSNPDQEAEYGIDSDNIFITGTSGGGKMASLAAITPTNTFLKDSPTKDDIDEVENNANVPQKPIRGVIMVNSDTQGTQHLRHMQSGSAAFMFWQGMQDHSIVHGIAETIEQQGRAVGNLGSQFYSLPNIGHNGAKNEKYQYTVNGNDRSLSLDDAAHDFMAHYLKKSNDNRPELSITGPTAFKENGNDGRVNITIELSQPAPTGGVSFIVSTDQIREATFVQVSGQEKKYKDGTEDELTKNIAKGPYIGTMTFKQGGKGTLREGDLPKGNFPLITAGNSYFSKDYTEKREKVTIPQGQRKHTFSVTLKRDGIQEENECFKVRILNASGAKIKDYVKYITILDGNGSNTTIPNVCTNIEGDAPSSPQPGPDPTVSVESVTTIEGDNAVVKIKLDQASTETVRVQYTTIEGSATEDVDYTARSGSIIFRPGEIAKTRTIEIIDDTNNELDETFNFVISNPVNATIQTGTAVITIQDDDDAPSLPVVSVESVTTIEGDNAVAVVKIKVNGTFTEDIQLNFETIDGSASANSDYIPRTGTVIFKASDNGKTLTRTIEIIDDTNNESDETFRFRLSNIEGGVLGTNNATITIKDDDENLPSISVLPKTIKEGSRGGIEITVTGNITDAITLNYRTINQKAKHGSDYIKNTGTLTFTNSKKTKFIGVQTLQDTEEESDETFIFEAFDIQNAQQSIAQAIVTIQDDDLLKLTSGLENVNYKIILSNNIGSVYSVQRLDGEAIKRVAIYDISGRLRFTNQYNGLNQVDIQVGNLATGVYIFVVNGSYREKRIINN